MKLSAMALVLILALSGCGGGQTKANPCGGTSAKSLAASVAIIPSSGTSYIVQGNDLAGVSGIKVTITYDPAILSGPTVTAGSLLSGEMVVSNTAVVGTITIVAITATSFSGKGPIATVTFAESKGSNGISSIITQIARNEAVLSANQMGQR